MKPRISMITVGVDDLEASFKFYRDGLGLPTEGIIGGEFEHGAIALFDLQHGFKLAIFSRANLALDAGITKTGRSPTSSRSAIWSAASAKSTPSSGGRSMPGPAS